jgi:hypothetical protein
VLRIFCQADVIDVRDHVARDFMPIQPTREREHAPFGAAHRLNLGEDDNPRMNWWGWQHL